MYRIKNKRKVEKRVKKLPLKIQQSYFKLVQDLMEMGPIQSNWPNFSKLEKNKYHCHLSRSWVACWVNENNSLVIEIYYVGSRENAPY